MFKTRVASGAVLMVILLGCTIFGDWLFGLMLLAISLIGLYELYRLEHIEKTGLFAAAVICTVLYDIGVYMACSGLLIMIILPIVMIVLQFIILSMIYVLTYPKFQAKQVMLAMFSFFYVPVMISCLFILRNIEAGKFLIWLVFIASWGCDTGAYCSGMLLGKHKLAPVLSPKKSVEGAIGGVVASVILGLIYMAIFGSHMTEVFSNPMLAVAVICAVGAILSQFGDLTASAIKRNYEIKDYGTLIPGHGGIMDRFDSVIFVSPVIFGLVMLFSVI